MVLGRDPAKALFPNVDPVGKTIRIGADEYEVIGVRRQAAEPGGFNGGQDDFVVIPYTTYREAVRLAAQRPDQHQRRRDHASESAMIAVVPREGVPPAPRRCAEVEEIMRIRHGLKLEQPNDFDIITQDAVLKMWDQISRAHVPRRWS